MEKMERKKVVLLTLLDDWEKLCRETISKLGSGKYPYTRGFISGELNAIKIIRNFIDEAWRQ